MRTRIALSIRRALLAAGPDSALLATYRSLRSLPLVRLGWRLVDPSADDLSVAAYEKKGGSFTPSPAHDDAGPSPEFYQPGYFDHLLRAIGRARAQYEPVERRVVLVNNGLSAGGAERQIVYTLTGLKARGWDARFVGEYLHAAHGLDFHLPGLQGAGVAADALPPLKPPLSQMYGAVTREVADALSRLPPTMVFEILAMADHLRAERPQVLHLWQDETSIKHAISGLIAGAPQIILSGRNLNPTHFAYHREHMRAGYQALANHPRVTLSNNSQAGADSYSRWLGIDPPLIRVVRNGVDTARWSSRSDADRHAWRQAHGIDADARVVVGVFRLADEKRPLLWLDTAAQARGPKDAFVLIGDGPLRKQVDGHIAARGLQDCVLRLGEVADVASALAAADAFMLASAQEGLPNVLLEAQWYGLPCLTTNAGGAAEAVLNGVTGVVADTDDAKVLGAALANLLADSGLARTAREQGPAFVQRAFGLDRMLDETERLYEASQDRA